MSQQQATDRYASLAPSTITFPAGRQRTELELDDNFLSSIKLRGILCPLLVTADHVLIAGGRRLSAALTLSLSSVPVRYVSESLTPTELRVIELEENVRRRDLPWRDQCRALAEIHKIWCDTRENWTQEKSEKELAWTNLGRWLRIYRDIDNPRLTQATSYNTAFNICQRIDARVGDSVLEDISSFGSELASELDELAESEVPTSDSAESGSAQLPDEMESAPQSTPAQDRGASTSVRAGTTPRSPAASARTLSLLAPEERDILHCDFKDWARTYAGPRFNFIHCDFPYGKKVFSGQWGGKNDPGFQYSDEPDTYWELIETLCGALERIATPTAHLMFWLSSEVEMQHATIARFRKLAPELIFQQRAFVWLKSDNVGIVPDPKRGPRWITELALMATRGDRTLVRPLGNAYAAPTARQLHPSAKPEPVLRHFFGMFVDGTSRVLDPTCGSGSALRAAETLGAASVLGLERDEQYVSAARRALKEFRNLRELTR